MNYYNDAELEIERLNQKIEDLSIDNRELRKLHVRYIMALEKIKNLTLDAPELNMDNYTEQQIEELNHAMIAINLKCNEVIP